MFADPINGAYLSQNYRGKGYLGKIPHPVSVSGIVQEIVQKIVGEGTGEGDSSSTRSTKKSHW